MFGVQKRTKFEKNILIKMTIVYAHDVVLHSRNGLYIRLSFADFLNSFVVGRFLLFGVYLYLHALPPVDLLVLLLLQHYPLYSVWNIGSTTMKLIHCRRDYFPHLRNNKQLWFLDRNKHIKTVAQTSSQRRSVI